jgi:hypothetical protein
MSFKVWRRKTDNIVVGFCDGDYTGFEPGGNPASYVMSIEDLIPTMPAPLPTTKQIALSTLLVDATVPLSVKNFLQTL